MQTKTNDDHVIFRTAPGMSLSYCLTREMMIKMKYAAPNIEDTMAIAPRVIEKADADGDTICEHKHKGDHVYGPVIMAVRPLFVYPKIAAGYLQEAVAGL